MGTTIELIRDIKITRRVQVPHVNKKVPSDLALNAKISDERFLRLTTIDSDSREE